MEPIQEGKDQFIVDRGSGEMLRFDNTYGNITVEQGQAALDAEQEILQEYGQAQTSYYRLAAKLAEFKTKRLFLARGYSSFGQWADSAELKGIGKRTAYNLVRIAEEALPILEKHGALDALPPLSTMYDMLPILRDENAEEKFVEAAYEVQDKTNHDAKQIIRDIRGLEPKDNDLTFFKLNVREVDDEFVGTITATSPTDYYVVGNVKIKRKDWPRFEHIVRGYVEIQSE